MKNLFDLKAQFGTEIKYFGHTLGVEGKNQDSNANYYKFITALRM